MLARFRRENAGAFRTMFRETVVLGLGLARLGHVALDGTKRPESPGLSATDNRLATGQK